MRAGAFTGKKIMTEQQTETTLDVEKLSLLSRLGMALSHPRAPLVAGGVVLALVGGFLLKQYFPALGGKPNIVVFDPVKFVNAQRAAASILAVSPSADLTLTMTQVAKQSEAVIKEEARGAVVLVKQSVVVPDDLPDITDKVLTRFGLPTKVPTVSTRPGALMLENIAPTDAAFGAGKLREDYRVELDNQAARLAQESAKQAKQTDVLP